jgi:hypothetical protein
VPLQALVDKFSHARFEPSGMTKNPRCRFAKSIVDYIFRWMATKFLSPEAQFRAGVNMKERRGPGGRSRERSGRKRRRPALPGARRLSASRREKDLRVRGDAQSGRRAAVQHLRLDHDPQRQLLQVRELWNDVRLRLTSYPALSTGAANAAPESGAHNETDYLGRVIP